MNEIETEDYVIVNEGEVVEGIENFIAQCVVLDPKARDLAPGKLQKAITKTMVVESKVEKVGGIRPKPEPPPPNMASKFLIKIRITKKNTEQKKLA
ncbi:OLC1v1011903C1 [Oldenlandia corymbosa var. corymbosa]|uniref:OLC1v1011903C1 n=1 Tax=Oldenlandia corymbosa var. corymbosa TaxID=529605 RepID=A0AAV1DXT0_OLDCO|nr:OLC1v1011903C1 [Oldenlandia corymbosa var. corymbosa]